MKRHAFLSRERKHLSAGKLLLIVAALLSTASMAKAQAPVDVGISPGTASSVRLGDGQDIEFQIFVGVESRRQASGAVVTAELPAGVTFSSVKTDTGTCSFADNRITCNLGVVGRDGQIPYDYWALVQIYVKPTETGTVSLTARITTNEPDPNLANNTATATTTVNSSKSRKRVRIT